MTTKQIDYVLELAKTLNFSRAAENLFISQPSLTYQIKLLEEEVGFKIFERSGKGAALTPAGNFFCSNLRNIRDELKDTIEQSQNIGSKYVDILNVCIPMRSCIYYLPQIMKEFEKNMPDIALNISFIYDNSRVDGFLKQDHDILFARDSELMRFSNIKINPLYKSKFYIIANKNDPLAKLEIITESDLEGRTFMIGGGSPSEMIAVQNRIINNVSVNTINSLNHDMSLTYVAAGRGIVLAPGFANDHNGEFAWIPFDCPEHINCILGSHKTDKRHCTKHFIELAQAAYTPPADISL